MFRNACFRYLMILLALLAHYILKNTAYGRYLYTIGGNIEAARLSGINTNIIRGSTYVLASILAGLSGIMGNYLTLFTTLKN